MKVAYFDCISGISGDMTLGALVDAGVGLDVLNRAIGSLGLPGCRLVAEEVRKKGFRATQIKVQYEPEDRHRHWPEILALIRQSGLPGRQRQLAEQIFLRLAEAEARVHGVPLEKVHFHELGAADSIADIVGTAVGLDVLGLERIVASPVAVGGGQVRIAHGLCSVPAPATAELLKGIPLARSEVACELTTPTGAAILAAVADGFGPLPAMTIERIGYGAGQRDLEEQPNLLRLFVGRTGDGPEHDQAWVLETNLDDISGEVVGFCISRLWEAGALDVFTTPIQMKKNRPGVKLSVLCRAEQMGAMEAILFSETTTLGVRRWPVSRHVLKRRTHRVETPWGEVEGKVGWLGEGPPRFAPEFEACQQIARANDLPLRVVYEAAQRAFDPKDVEN
ncbi:MAG TPA: nickel pincer cofactor biosynthesis protein LarC [Planctomycetaceae bacterium]|nr:nickel pincer cofactor biosynthesis protein LarC [Planctomycetaceae bacterium]HIQ20642.1 nickel pincer cofactor biosynthesis protein LarC [Planctomycetota bacterium]